MSMCLNGCPSRVTSSSVIQTPSNCIISPGSRIWFRLAVCAWFSARQVVTRRCRVRS